MQLVNESMDDFNIHYFIKNTVNKNQKYMPILSSLKVQLKFKETIFVVSDNFFFF